MLKDFEDRVAALREAKRKLDERKAELESGEFLRDLIPEENMVTALTRYTEWRSAIEEEEEILDGERSILYSDIKQECQNRRETISKFRVGNILVSPRRTRKYDLKKVADIATYHGITGILKEAGALVESSTTEFKPNNVPPQFRGILEEARYVARTDIILKEFEDNE